MSILPKTTHKVKMLDINVDDRIMLKELTYIHTLLLPPQWGFSGTIIQITKVSNNYTIKITGN